MNMPWCLGITVASSCSLESGKAFEHRTYYLAADGIEEYNGWTRALADYYAAGNGIASAGAGSNGGGHDTRDNIGYSAECITAGEAIAPPPARAAPLPPHLPLLTLPLAAAVDVRQSAVVCSTAKFKSRASEETSALSSSYESAGSCARTHVRPSDGSGYHGTVITDQTMGSVPAVWDRSASCASQISVKTASPRMVIGSPASSHISSALPVQHGTQSSSVGTRVAPTNANDYLIPKAGRSVTLYGAFFEAYKCINDYMAYLQDRKREQMERADVTCADCSRADNDCDRENAKAVANHASGEPAQIACAILSHRPINYMDPATVVVRSVRHLLYFIDSTIMKKMHHPDFQPCLKRFMSVVVERSRKVGFLAKSMTESECIGLPRAASLPELIDHLERLTMELQTFVNLAKFISDLDFAAGGALAIMSSSTGSSLMCKTILDCCNDYAKGVQSEKIERMPTVIEKMRLFAQIAAHACHHQFNEGFDFQTPPHQANNAETRRFLFGSTTEMRNIGRQLDFQREELCARFHATKNSAAEESLIVALALAERVFSVALLLVRLAVTLEYLDSIDHEAAAGFWESYNAFSSSCHSVPQPVPSLSSVDSRKLSFDLDEMMATLVGGAPGADTSPRLGSDTIPPSPAVTGNSADCASTDLDRLSLAPIADSQRNHHARSLPTKSDVAALSALQHAKNDSLILRSAPPPPPPIERPYKSFSYGTRATAVVKSRLSVVGRSFYQSFNNPVEQLRYEYSVNAAVVKSVSELHTVVLAASKNMIALWGASQAATALDRHDTIERAVQLSMSIFTAAAQLQEELGALEYQTSTDALIQRLDDAQHALMRAATCFENSVKSLTNFYSPPDAWKDVIMDARRLEDVCAAVVRSIEDVLQHQSSILYRNNQATAGQTLDTSTEAGWFTRSLQPKTSSPLSMVKPVNGEAEQEDLRAADAVKQAEVEAARLELEVERMDVAMSSLFAR